MKRRRHALSIYASGWLFIFCLVLLNPCLLYCTLTHDTLHADLNTQTRLATFLCQLTSTLTPADQASHLAQHHTPGSTPLNQLALVAQMAFEFLPQHTLIILIPALLLAFISSSQSLRVPSLCATPPTPPPRFAW